MPLSQINHFDSVPFLDLRMVWRTIADTPAPDRLRGLLEIGGVTFHDAEHLFVDQPSVALVGIGGLPIQIVDSVPRIGEQVLSIEYLREQFATMSGFGGMMTYLNPKDKQPSEMAKTLESHGHFSTLHTISLNLVVLGFSCAVENEFNSQRDLVHLSRVTAARTHSQNSPPVVVLDSNDLPLFQKTREFVVEQLSGRATNDENLNNLFPAAKASLAIFSASVRNLQKLVAQRHDTGKEKEYCRILERINQVLNPMLPDSFPSD